MPQVDAEKAKSSRAKHAANREAFLYFQRGRDMGEPNCIVNLAYHRLHGLGVAKDPTLALRYEEEAAQAGHAMVCYRALCLSLLRMITEYPPCNSLCPSALFVPVFF